MKQHENSAEERSWLSETKTKGIFGSIETARFLEPKVEIRLRHEASAALKTIR